MLTVKSLKSLLVVVSALLLSASFAPDAKAQMFYYPHVPQYSYPQYGYSYPQYYLPRPNVNLGGYRYYSDSQLNALKYRIRTNPYLSSTQKARQTYFWNQNNRTTGRLADDSLGTTFGWGGKWKP